MKFRLFLLITILLNGMNCYAGDLDDGIGIDEPINDDISLGKNVQFIIRNALAKGKSGKSKEGGGGQTDACGSGNIVIGAGSKVKEVINISTNKGTTAVCGK